MRNNANIKKRLNRLESFEDCRFVKPKLSTSFWSDARNGFRRHRQTSWCFRPNCCIGTPCKRQWSIGDPSGRRSRLCLSSRRDLVPDVFIRRPRPELSKMRRSKLQNSRKRHQKTNDCLRRSGCLGKPDQRQCCAGHWRSGIQLRRPHCRIHGRFMRDVLDAANSTLQLGKRTWKDTAEYMQEIGEVLSEKYRQVKGTFRRHLAEIFRDEYAEEDIAQARDFLSQYGFHLSSILLSELNTTIWFEHISKYVSVLLNPKFLKSPAEGEEQLVSGEVRELFEFLNEASVIFTQIDWVQKYAPGLLVNAYLDVIFRNKHRIILRFLEEQIIPISSKCGLIARYSLEMTFNEGTVYATELKLLEHSARTKSQCTSAHQGTSHTQICLDGEDLRRVRGSGPTTLYGKVKVYLCVKWQGPSAKYIAKNGVGRPIFV